jgi:type II secretory pathway pseudopilin PulG
MKKINKNSKGFTLVEVLVVVATFIIIVIASVDLFVLMVSHQRRILAEQELSSQTSYITEYMSRALRMAKKDETGACLGAENIGRNYLLTQEASGVYHGIKFINASNQNICQEFILESGRIKEIKDSSPAIPITSETLLINNFNIVSYGDIAGDLQQPRVTIAMDVEQKTKDFDLKKNMQITISQRNLDE